MDISEVKVMHLQPGDTLVVRTEQPLSVDTCERLKEYLSSVLPDGVKCLVLEKGIDLEIVRAEA